MKELKKLLSDEFEMKDVGEIGQCLGLNITGIRDSGTVEMGARDMLSGRYCKGLKWKIANPTRRVFQQVQT